MGGLDELKRLPVAHQRTERPVAVAACHDGVHVAGRDELIGHRAVRAERLKTDRFTP